MNFEKANNADWNLSENQDSLSPTVIITRKSNKSLFNIAQEDEYSASNGSPVGTLWAHSATQNVSSENYVNFVAMHAGAPQSLIGQTVSLYLPGDGFYFDIVFSSYSGSNSGGGFAYTRTCILQDDLSVYNEIIPKKYSIYDIYPNPFNPITNIQYSLPINTDLELGVYDIIGSKVQTLERTFNRAGKHSINWNASESPSGIYFVKISTSNFTETKKVMLVK